MWEGPRCPCGFAAAGSSCYKMWAGLNGFDPRTDFVAWRCKDWHGLHESSYCYFRVYAGTRNLKAILLEHTKIKWFTEHCLQLRHYSFCGLLQSLSIAILCYCTASTKYQQCLFNARNVNCDVWFSPSTN